MRGGDVRLCGVRSEQGKSGRWEGACEDVKDVGEGKRGGGSRDLSCDRRPAL